MASSPMRYKKFLELLPKYNYVVTKAAKEAGFSEHTSNTQQKRILQSALKYELKSREESVKNNLVQNKDVSIDEVKTMAQQVGISKDELMENIKTIANQEKDWSTRLKVVSVLAKEFGLDLSIEENNKTIAPVLNITVKEKEKKQNEGLVEPYLDIDPME